MSAECVTACGLRSSQIECTQLKHEEARILAAFPTFVREYSVENVCHALNGWTVVLHEQTTTDIARCGFDSWAPDWLPPPFCLLGYAHADTRTIELGDQFIQTNAFAHEVVHVVDLALFHHAGHCRWAARGVDSAIVALTGKPAHEVVEPECLP